MDWMTEKNPVFDLVISQETIFQALSNYSQNQTLKNFCQFNFIQRIYGLAGPPQQLEFVTVPLATQRFIFLIPFFLRITVFENWQKSHIQHCERSELHFEWTKVDEKCQKKLKIVLPDTNW